MNLVDSSGWLEYFARGVNASFFAPAIKARDSLIVPTICLYEVFKRLLKLRDEEDALAAVGVMSLGILVDLTREIAVDGAWISYELQIAMADSIILSTARAYKATLWTQDADFKSIEGIRYIEKR